MMDFQLFRKNVILSAGSKILKNVKVGNNCVIGANTIITTDEPENSLVKLSKICIEVKNLKENK